MPRPKPESASRRAARWLLAEPGRALPEASKLYGVTRQAVSQAVARLTSRAKPGRPRVESPRRNLTVRLDDGRRVSVHLTEAEIAAWSHAAGKGGIGPWIRGVLEQRPAPNGAKIAAWMRTIGNAAAGLPSD